MAPVTGSQPLRLGMDITSLLSERTGVAAMVEALVTGLPEYDGLDLTGLLVSRRGRERLSEVLPKGWTGRALRLPARPSHLAWRYLGVPKLRGYDLVHGPNYLVPPAVNAARLVTVHDLTAWKYPEMVNRFSRHYPVQLERAVNSGAHVHTVSHYVREELVEDLGLDPDRVHVVPNGFEPPVGGSRRQGQQLVGAPYVLAIGTIEPRKGFGVLVEAMAEVCRLDPALQLVIVGGDGWGREAFDETVDRMGMQGRIRLTGYVDGATKANLLAGAELLAYPSLYEGFGLPLLEAMHVGTPVVATTAGSIPEVAGDAAMLVEKGEVEGLAAGIVSVLEDATLRRQLISAGRQRAKLFSWDTAVASLVDLYRRLVEQSSGRSFEPMEREGVEVCNDRVLKEGAPPR